MFLPGYFDVDYNEAQSFNICKHHRDRLGIYWRGRSKNCQIPPETAGPGHKSAVKGVHGLVKHQSAYIKKMTGKLIPVGSGMLTTSHHLGESKLKSWPYFLRRINPLSRIGWEARQLNGYCAGFRIEWTRFKPWPWHCVVILSKTLHSHSSSLYPGV